MSNVRAAQQPEQLVAPPIFWTSNDDEPKKLKAPIYLVYVTTVNAAGESVPLDCTPLSGLPTYPHMLAEKYGVPIVELVGRSENGQILIKAVHRCRVVSPAPTSPAASSSAAPDPVTKLQDRVDQLVAELAKSREESHKTVLDLVTKMTSTRIADAQDVFNALLKSRGAGAGDGGKSALEAYKEGFKYMQELAAAAAEGGEEGADDLFEKIKIATEAFKTFTEADKKTKKPENDSGSTNGLH